MEHTSYPAASRRFAELSGPYWMASDSPAYGATRRTGADRDVRLRPRTRAIGRRAERAPDQWGARSR
ncbi:hypothetical protein GCM10010446_40720 [Streptomyces enissocaesilis]|uniref:Uncharacterized protein n=1 Tax=Streptomyces enissocaesilis TaxID=332589 RepID=A0ABN3XGD3_9ACTN